MKERLKKSKQMNIISIKKMKGEISCVKKKNER